MKAEQPLVDRYLDGELTTDEQDRLAEWLTADPEHVRQFVRETSLHRQIRETMLARPYRAYGLSEEGSPEPKARPASVPVSVRRNQAVVAADGRRRISGRLSASSPRRLQFERAAKPFLLALAASIILVAGVWLFGPTMGAPTLAEVNGVGLFLERTGRSIPAVAGMRLQSGDLLRAPGNVTAAISFAPENTRITIQPGTELKLASMSRGKRFALGAGKLEATVARQRPFQPMVLVTAQAEAQVLGTKFTLTSTTNATRLEVSEGKVKLTRTSDETTVKVSAGHYAIAATNVELAAQPFTGRILREYWTEISGDAVGMLTTHTNYPDKPSGRDFLTSFEELTDWSASYGTRIRGYLYPPKTGQYRFWVAADDCAELYLSADDSPDQKDVIASVYFRSQPREWTKYPWQQSASIKLKANHRYYIELLHKKNDGAGHLAVAWQTPGGKQEIIPGAFLAPFKTDAKEMKQ